MACLALSHTIVSAATFTVGSDDVNLVFVPSQITIHVGDTVHWNQLLTADPHNVAEITKATWDANGATRLAGGFFSGREGFGDTFDFRFEGAMYPPGTYYYVCQPHALAEM